MNPLAAAGLPLAGRLFPSGAVDCDHVGIHHGPALQQVGTDYDAVKP